MPFSLGAVELLLLAVLVILCALLYGCRHESHSVCFALLVCAALAAFLTPADISSTVWLFTAFVAVFMFGLRYRIGPSATIT